MPEMRFRIRWPDGQETDGYSPSTVIAQHFEPGGRYPLADFVRRCRTALLAASERVRERYGLPCGRALGQLEAIERAAERFQDSPRAPVIVVALHRIGTEEALP